MINNSSEIKVGLKSINLPESLQYSTDSSNKPVSFIIDLFLNSSLIYLKLGYFSSSALFALSCCFAQFIKNGGNLKIVCNKHLTKEDIDVLNDSSNHYIVNEQEALSNLLLSSKKHFYECLKYLLSNNRLEIIPIDALNQGLVHYKEGIAKDNAGNEIFFSGSMNFTYSGIFHNGESITVSRSWGYPPEKTRIEENLDSFESLFSKKHPAFTTN